MGLRFYRRVHLLPGVRLNLTTRGASLSFGRRGAWLTFGRAGRRTATLGFGHGLRYTSTTIAGATRQATPPAPSAVRTLAWLLLAVIVGTWVFVRLLER